MPHGTRLELFRINPDGMNVPQLMTDGEERCAIERGGMVFGGLRLKTAGYLRQMGFTAGAGLLQM